MFPARNIKNSQKRIYFCPYFSFSPGDDELVKRKAGPFKVTATLEKWDIALNWNRLWQMWTDGARANGHNDNICGWEALFFTSSRIIFPLESNILEISSLERLEPNAASSLNASSPSALSQQRRPGCTSCMHIHGGVLKNLLSAFPRIPLKRYRASQIHRVHLEDPSCFLGIIYRRRHISTKKQAIQKKPKTDRCYGIFCYSTNSGFFSYFFFIWGSSDPHILLIIIIFHFYFITLVLTSFIFSYLRNKIALKFFFTTLRID